MEGDEGRFQSFPFNRMLNPLRTFRSDCALHQISDLTTTFVVTQVGHIVTLYLLLLFTTRGVLRSPVCCKPIKIHLKKAMGERSTYSLPVQNVDASDANQAITPLTSSGRPIRPSGFKPDHLSNKCGCVSR